MLIRLTQEFYQERRENTEPNESQETIEAHHVGWRSLENQLQSYEIATDLPWINWQQVKTVLDVGCGYGRLSDFLRSNKTVSRQLSRH
jgi:2-polyprenyl-3-methyl-5-hydroxy-6-metoxy-1,4-benzoquinol methylase